MSSLMDAPAYNESAEKRKTSILIAIAAAIVLFIVLTFVGYVTGHGWLFSNYPAQVRIGHFFDALEAKDYAKAYGIYNNDANWAAHPDKYKDYPLARFTEDWTTHSPIEAPITSHHVDASATDGSGTFGTGIIVAVNVNDKKEIFMYYLRADGTLTWPAPHELTRY